jgi:hypothetical protein
MRLILCLFALSLSASGLAQVDTAFLLKVKGLDTADLLKLDTLTPPKDALTAKIKTLRAERHGINIDAVIQIKLMEERAKDTVRPAAFYDKLQAELTTGRTGQLLENSIVNLYRRTFNESDLDELIRFYKTPAGKKMDKEFILLLVASVKDAEQLMKMAFVNLSAKP